METVGQGGDMGMWNSQWVDQEGAQGFGAHTPVGDPEPLHWPSRPAWRMPAPVYQAGDNEETEAGPDEAGSELPGFLLLCQGGQSCREQQPLPTAVVPCWGGAT